MISRRGLLRKLPGMRFNETAVADPPKVTAQPDSGDVHVDGFVKIEKRDDDEDDDEKKKTAETEPLTNGEPQTAAELSQEQIRQKMQAALDARFGRTYYSWIAATYEDRLVYQNDAGELFEVGWSLEDGEVRLGDDATPVVMTYARVGDDDGPVEAGEPATNVLDVAASHGEQRTRSAALFVDVGQALMTSDLPEWVPCLPVPGTYKHAIYGTIEMTVERNQGFVDNFNAHVYQPTIAIDAEHNLKESGAVGYIDQLRLNEDGSVDAHVEKWTDTGQKLLGEDRFRYVSPEWYDEWTNPGTGETYSDVLVGLALTNRPFFKDKALRPLVASEGQMFAFDESASDAAAVFFTQLPTPREEAVTVPAAKPAAAPPTNAAGEPKPATAPTAPAPTAPAVAVTPQAFAEMQRQLGELTAERDAARQAAEAATAAATAASERVTVIENAARRRRFTDEVMGRSEDSGVRWFGEVEKHVATMETLADKLGEDSDAFKQYVEVNRTAASQLRESGAFAERGRAGAGPDSPVAKAQAMARTIATERSISEAEALSQVFAENPSLYSDYVAASQVKV